MPQQCEVCPVRNQGLCGTLADDEIASLSAVSWHRRFRAGQPILADQEKADFLATVISGTVKLVMTLPSGREQIVGLALASDFIGHPFRKGLACTVEAAGDVRLCTFRKDRFDALAREYPAIERWLLRNALDELDAARDWILLLGRKTAEQRVASFLIRMAERLRRGATERDGAQTIELDLPLSRSEMADYLGLTLETVSRQIAYLRKSGVIGLPTTRSIVIREPEALRCAADGGSPSLVA